MPQWLAIDYEFGGIVWAAGLALASVVVAFIVNFILGRGAKALADMTTTNLDNLLIKAIQWPLLVGIVIGGVYLAAESWRVLEPYTDLLRRGFGVVGIFMAAWTVLRVVQALLHWYEEEIAAKTKSGLDDRLVPIVRRGMNLVTVALAAIGVLNLVGVAIDPVNQWLAQHGLRLLIILALIVLAFVLVDRMVPGAIRTAVVRGRPGLPEMEVKKQADTLANVLVTSLQVFLLVLTVFMVLTEVGIDIGPLVAGAGVVGIAIGFGAQGLVKDIIAGIFVILEGQYRVGDVVGVAGVSGLVEDINLRRTVLRDWDGAVHYVPNGEIKVASNFTRERSRVNMNVSVGYREDLDRVMAVIDRVGKELAADPAWAPQIISPARSLRVDKFGDSGIEVKITGETQPGKQWDVMGELRLRLKRAFDQEGIEIPWPHMKLYFGETPPGFGGGARAAGPPHDKKGP